MFVVFSAVFSAVNNKIKIPSGAEELVGKAVEHLFEKEDGEKNEWRGMVLSRAPIMTNWYYITYEKDPVLYMYQLWDDYADGDLRILPEAGMSFIKNRSQLVTAELTVMVVVLGVCPSDIIRNVLFFLIKVHCRTIHFTDMPLFHQMIWLLN